MKLRTKLTAALLCLVALLCLFGCNNTPADTEPTLSVAEIVASYEAICKPLAESATQQLTITSQEQRTVGGETYTEKVTGTAYYKDLGKDTFSASVDVTLLNGTYENKYSELYVNGTAYAQVMERAFSAIMTQDEFLERQIPAILLDGKLYQTVITEQVEGKTLYRFSDAAKLESWVTNCDSATLSSAEGVATVDENGVLTEMTYTAAYSCGATEYTLAVTVCPSTEPALVEYAAPAESTPLTFLDAPRLLIKAAGDIYTSKAITGSYSEHLYSQAAAIDRTQSAQIDIWGEGDSFMAATSYIASLTNYTNTATVNTQKETFRDGSYSYSTNGGEPVNSDVTAEQMRSYCEQTILSAFFTIDSLSGAELADTGDFYYITFKGTDAAATRLCSSIYSILGVDLDGYAESFTTKDISGYMTIDKHTGLPTAAGMSMERSHMISNVAYSLTFRLDQSVNLSSATSYKNITGELPEETQPETTATPLFYEVLGPNDQKMWLLGTIHVGDERTAYLPQAIMDAYKNSSSLAVEFDMNAFNAQAETDAALQSELAKAYYYADGSTIKTHVDGALYEKAYPLLLASGNNSINAPYMKAALWYNLIDNFYLQQCYRLTPDKGVDQRLLDLAYADGKTIRSIETGLSQLKMLTGYSEALQAYLLKEITGVSSIEYGNDLLALYELWCKGDEAALTEALTSETFGDSEEAKALFAEYNKAMITNRNANMLKVAKGYLESGETVFYAVGLAHLLGDDGLVNGLRAAGYTVTAVTCG